ncbi:MAG: pyroglutamyl-peptidase I [Pseudobdellovibrio sp.]
MKILLTGFKAFLGEKINPSEILCQSFPDLQSLVLPVEFSRAYEVLKLHLLQNKYDYVLMLGQAAGRNKVSLEKIALNWVQSQHTDESGYKPESKKINESKPLALMSQFPIDDVYTKVKIKNPNIQISFSAGTYVCNELYFQVCSEFEDLKAVFVHVPLIKEQISAENMRPYLELNEQKEILSEILKSLN